MQSAPDTTESALLDVLRTFDNPFDTFVEARRRAGGFSRRHVPEVNETAWLSVESVLERFRHIARRRHPQDELPRAGILVVTGPRGAGKTHLLHALESEAPATVLAPSHYDVGRSFGEYVLHELVLALQQELPEGESALERLAERYTRDALIAALEQTDELTWLVHNARYQFSFWRLRLGAPDIESLTPTGELQQQLEARGKIGLVAQVEASGVDPRAVRSLLETHIHTTERGVTVEAHVRRTLMLRLIEAALTEDATQLVEYLVDGFTEMPHGLQPLRDNLVDALLTSLAQLLFVQERPVVLVFDALEALLGDPPDQERCRSFFGDIANHLDAFEGLLCLVLAEEGYFQDIHRKYATQYAQQRFEQGVPTLGKGSVSHVSLDPPGEPHVRAIVRRRMATLTARVDPGVGHVSSEVFPFSEGDVEQVLQRDGPLSLRRVLQILRDRYQEIVFGRSPPATDAPPDEETGPGDGAPSPDAAPETPAAKLTETWGRSVRAAQRQLGAQVVTAHADRIHKGLEAWLTLESEVRKDEAGPRLLTAKHEVFGTHPTYGQLVRCSWETTRGRVDEAVGFLLGRGPGMPRDLAEKLGGMGRDELGVETLRLLWPTTRPTGAGAVEALPKGTRAVWDRHVSEEMRGRIRLVPIGSDLLAYCLALLEWRQRWSEVGSAVDAVAALPVIEGPMRRLWNAICCQE